MKGDHSLTSPHHSQHVGAKRAADRTGEQFIFHIIMLIIILQFHNMMSFSTTELPLLNMNTHQGLFFSAI